LSTILVWDMKESPSSPSVAIKRVEVQLRQLAQKMKAWRDIKMNLKRI